MRTGREHNPVCLFILHVTPSPLCCAPDMATSICVLPVAANFARESHLLCLISVVKVSPRSRTWAIATECPLTVAAIVEAPRVVVDCRNGARTRHVRGRKVCTLTWATICLVPLPETGLAKDVPRICQEERWHSRSDRSIIAPSSPTRRAGFHSNRLSEPAPKSATKTTLH